MTLAGISAFTLHILAMTAMLLDHLWAQLVPGNLWLTCVGRIAFPIFAFLLVEGYFHTRNLKKYFLRLLIFALISEIPFNLMMGGSLFYPVHQNVLWTFLIGLAAIRAMEALRKKETPRIWKVLGCGGISLLAVLLGLVSFCDYNAPGVMMVLVFYFFHGRKWYHFAGQLVCLYWINNVLLMGMDLPFTLFGHEFFYPTQGFALLALIPIWLYRGKQGPHNRWIQYGFYAFYPLHILILALITMFR